MRLMERIRRHGGSGFKFFLVIFVISVFAGLGIGGFNLGNQQPGQGPGGISRPASAILNPQLKDVALLVNGRQVSTADYGDRVASFQQMMRGQLEDPLNTLMIYGYTVSALVQEEVLLGEAEKRRLKVAKADLDEERQKVVDQAGMPEQKTTGNMLGDAGKALGARRERNTVFKTALARMGMSDAEWEHQISRDVLLRKVREALQADLDAEVDLKAKEVRDKIDGELAAGAEFAELARTYSDATDSASQGGDMINWLLPGVLPDDANDQVLMATTPGELTPWFEVPAGYQRWQVYEREALDETELEGAKERLTEQLRNQKDDETYEPSEDELKTLAFKVKARQIMLNRTAPGAVQDKITELVDGAKVEINNPYALAYQALFDNKLQPMDGTGYEQLLAIAQKSLAGDGYNYDLIKGKLERGLPKTPGQDNAAEEAADETTPAAGESSQAAAASEAADAAETQDAAAVAEDDASAVGDEVAAADEAESSAEESAAEAAPIEAPVEEPAQEDDPMVPIYALAIGLLQLGLEGNNPVSGPFGEGIVARVYIDWLGSTDSLKGQPVQETPAREEIETRLARAVESDTYNATMHAERGYNLAVLGRKDEAATVLETAEKYAADQTGGALQKIKDAYDKLEMTEKANAIQTRLDDAMQRQMMEQIERAQAQQTAGGAAAPITIDMGEGQ